MKNGKRGAADSDAIEASSMDFYRRRCSGDGGLRLRFLGFLALSFCLATASALASPAIVMDVATGDVLYEEQATQPWYPASLTKLMTVYVALSAVRDHQITLDTPLVVSARAASMAPSKMGFKPGTEVTLGNALKMLMVKSANDIAVTVAEGIAGSVEAFAEDMNAAAARIGMRESHFVNPNGLHNQDHVSSARDLAVLARALYLTFPEYAGIFDIGALRLGDEIIPTHNNLLGRYPGADGMKTGFTCAAGFNLVASATRGNRHYIAVVLGAPSAQVRLMRIAVLLDRAFDGIDHPHPLPADQPGLGAVPDMHSAICSRRRGHTIVEFEAENARLAAPLASLASPAPNPPFSGLLNTAAMARQAPVALRIAMVPAPVFDPVPVYVGPAPGYNGPVAQARPPHSPIGTPPVAAAATVTPDKAQASEASDTDEGEDGAVPRAKAKAAKKMASSKAKKSKFAARHEDDDDESIDATDAPAKKHTASSDTKKHGDKAYAAKLHKGKNAQAKPVKGKTGKVAKAKSNKGKIARAKSSKIGASKGKPAKLSHKATTRQKSAKAGAAVDQ